MVLVPFFDCTPVAFVLLLDVVISPGSYARPHRLLNVGNDEYAGAKRSD